MPDYESFTDRELGIMRLMAQDMTNDEIAADLHISIKTVRWYLRQIYDKLNVHNRDDAITQIVALTSFETANTANQNRLHNLPAQVMTFVGREAELSEITDLLADPAYRLVSLVGPGGIGKTRLAIEVARFQLRHFTDGVYFVPCAPVNDSIDITPAIATALNYPLREDGRTAQQQLIGYLQHKNLLLIIDNFEHLLDGTPILTELLQAAPQLRLIITSRERLNALSEIIVNVGGLEIPAADSLEEILRSSAVKLFIQSAQRVQSSFMLQSEDTGVIKHICQQVGGMPLGILLAAAWVTLLTPQEIANEIDSSLGILSHEIRDLPPRQRSINAIFASAWGRLSADEQQVLMKLSVFRGGFTREAAQKVAGATLPILNSLVSKSMLQVTPKGRRYSIHELLRQYSEAQLEATHEKEAIRTAHCHYFMEFMSQRLSDLKGHHQIEAYDKIEADIDNIRAGWSWAVEHADYDELDLAVETILLLNWHFSHIVRTLDLFQTAQDRLTVQSPNEPHPVWWRIHIRLLHRKDFIDTTAFERCLIAARQRQDKFEEAFCVGAMGRVALLGRDFDRASQLLHESLELYLQLGEHYYAAHELWELRTCQMLIGDVEETARYRKECLRLRQQIGDATGIAWCVYAEHWELEFLREYQQAESQLHEALRLHRQVRNLFAESLILADLGLIAFLRGDLPEARMLIEASLQLGVEINFQDNRYYGKMVFGLIALMGGGYETAEFLQKHVSPGPSLLAWSIGNLVPALAACDLNDDELAAQLLRLLLNQGCSSEDIALLTWCLPVAAIIAAHGGKKEQAAELLGLAFTSNPTINGWMGHWSLLTQLRVDLQAKLGSDAYSRAWERGANSDLRTVAANLLKSHSPSE